MYLSDEIYWSGQKDKPVYLSHESYRSAQDKLVCLRDESYDGIGTEGQASVSISAMRVTGQHRRTNSKTRNNLLVRQLLEDFAHLIGQVGQVTTVQANATCLVPQLMQRHGNCAEVGQAAPVIKSHHHICQLVMPSLLQVNGIATPMSKDFYYGIIT